MTRRRRIRTWLSGIALALVASAAAAVSFAQFQVNQRRGWEAYNWLIAADAPLSLQIQKGLEQETVQNPNIKGQLLHIIAPSLGLDQTFVAGPHIAPTDHVRVASNIKPFVAAAALKLVETNKLSLDRSIAPYLTPQSQSLLGATGRRIDQITLRHLLSHTSGIADYGSSRLFQALAFGPTAFGLAWHWQPEDQIWFAAKFTPVSDVGSHFDYSDTNYLLASEMIAKAIGAPNPGVGVRQVLNWPAIGAPQTFWEFYEPTPPKTQLVRHFRGAIEDTKLDVSFDQYGGGGLVMTMADLAHAHRAVVRGEIFSRPETRTIMQTPSNATGSNGYALGLAPITIEGETCWNHGGRWGTIALYCPDIDVSIARSWGQSNAGPDIDDTKGIVAAIVRLATEKVIADQAGK
jgi:D-alanyl-D-alanine carboxypeptidase